MRLWRAKRPPAKPAIEFCLDLEGLAQRNLRRQYSKGLEDGTITTLDMIEGNASYGGEPYRGPLPAELRDWIAAVRANARSAA